MGRAMISKLSKNPKKKLFTDTSKPQPKTRREYIYTVLTIIAQKLGLLKELLAIKRKFDLYYQSPKLSQFHQKGGRSPSPSSSPRSVSAEGSSFTSQVDVDAPLSDTFVTYRTASTTESPIVQPTKQTVQSSPSLMHTKSAASSSQSVEEGASVETHLSKKSLSLPKELRINTATATGLHIKSQSKPSDTSRGPQSTPIETKREVASESRDSNVKEERQMSSVQSPRHHLTLSDTSSEITSTKNTAENKEISSKGEDDARYRDWGKATEKFIKEVIGENSKVTTLLKSVASQGIVSPAWVRLKLMILPDFPFRDIPNGWKVFIHFANNEITVVHEKKERSSEETKLGVPDFEFTWELRLVFDKKLETLKESKFLISRLVTSDAMNVGRKAQLKAIMEQYKALGFKQKLTPKKKVFEAKNVTSQMESVQNLK